MLFREAAANAAGARHRTGGMRRTASAGYHAEMEGNVTHLDSWVVHVIGRELGSSVPAVFVTLPCHARPERHEAVRVTGRKSEILLYRCGFRWWARQVELGSIPRQSRQLTADHLHQSLPIDIAGVGAPASEVVAAALALI